MQEWFEDQIGEYWVVAKVVTVNDSLGVPMSDFVDIQVSIIDVKWADGRDELISRDEIERIRDNVAEIISNRYD